MALKLGDTPSFDVLNKPELNPGNELYFIAYQELDAERPPGYSATRIPGSKIIEWGLYYGLDGEEIEDLKYAVTQMDIALLDKINSKNKANQDGKKPKRPSK